MATARVVGILITAITFPYLIRRLGVDIYGLWSYVVAVCAFSDTIANPGLSTYVAQQVAARRQSAFETVSDVLMIRLLTGAAAVGVILLVSAFEVRPDVKLLLKWYGIAAIFVSMVASEYLLSAMELFHLRAVLTVAQQSLYAVGILVLVRSPKDIVWVPVSILGSSLLTNLFGWMTLWQKGFRFKFAIVPQRWPSILVPSFHYAMSSLMSNFYHRSGHIAVRWFLGDHALGLYAAAARLADLLRHFVSIAHNILMPRMALDAYSATGLKRTTRIAVSLAALFGIPLTVGAIITAPLVVPWILGKQFQDAVPAFRWVAPYLVTASAATLFSGTVLYALGRHRAYLLSTATGALTTVALNLVLPPFFGIVGACLAFVLGEAGVAVSAYFLSPLEVREVCRTPVIGVAIGGSLMMGIALAMLQQKHLHPLVVIGIGLSVYLLACAWMGQDQIRREFQNLS